LLRPTSDKQHGVFLISLALFIDDFALSVRLELLLFAHFSLVYNQDRNRIDLNALLFHHCIRQGIKQDLCV